MKFLQIFQKSSAKKRFTAFLSFLLISISVFTFQACHKDALFENQSNMGQPTPTIKIEDAKAWFEQQIRNQGSQSSLLGDSLQLFGTTSPEWQLAINDFSKIGKEFILAPIDLTYDKKTAGTKLAITKDVNGNFVGAYMMYIADETYDKQTQGNYQPENFTGSIVYIGLDGKYLSGVYVQNGKMNGLVRAVKKNNSTTSGLNPRDVECFTYEVKATSARDISLKTMELTTCVFSGGGWTGNINTYNNFNTGGLPIGGGDITSTGGGGDTWGGNQPTNVFGNHLSDMQLQQYLIDNGFESDLSYFAANSDVARLIRSYVGFTGDEFKKLKAHRLIDALRDFPEYNTWYKEAGLPRLEADVLDKYVNAGFTVEEYVAMRVDFVLFDHVKAFLDKYNHNEAAVYATKKHVVLYNSNTNYNNNFNLLPYNEKIELIPFAVTLNEAHLDPVNSYLLIKWWLKKTPEQRIQFIKGFYHQTNDFVEGILGTVEFYKRMAQQLAKGGRYCVTNNCSDLPILPKIESDFFVHLLESIREVFVKAANGDEYAQGQLLFEAAMFFVPVGEELRVTSKITPKFLFRGTSEGFIGSEALRRLGITPTSMDPAIATVFATESSNFGSGVLYIVKLETLEAQGIKTTVGNVLEKIEVEVPLLMQPAEFPAKSFIKISADRARQILREMGIDIPTIIRKDGGQMDQILKALPPMTEQQIETFIFKAQQ